MTSFIVWRFTGAAWEMFHHPLGDIGEFAGEQSRTEVLCEQSCHVLVFGVGPEAIEETDVTATGCDDNGDVCRFFSGTNWNGCNRQSESRGRTVVDMNGICILLTFQWLEWIVGSAQAQQWHRNLMQFVMQRSLIVIVVNVFETEMLAREIGVELFDCLALEHLVHVDVFVLVEYLAGAECVAQAGGQVLAQHTVQIGLFDALAACRVEANMQ